jgi:hypothetical protein
LLCAVLALLSAQGSLLGAEELVAAAKAQMAKYAGQMEDLARWCDQQGLAEQAQKTRAWLAPRDPGKLYVVILPETIGRPKLPPDASKDVAQWDARFAQLQRDQAGALFGLAQRAMRAGRSSLAFDLLMAAVRENPDHEVIRQKLGYQKFRGSWRTQFEVANLRADRVWHDKFGWLPKSFVRRYEQGQRFLNGRWVGADDEARQRREIDSGWEVETEHYVIRTNHSLEAGVALGRNLEKLYRVWKQLFFRYYTPDDQAGALFEGGGRLARHHVVYFRDKDDYVRALRSGFPNIEMSIGIYADGLRRACFFAGDEYSDRTLFHEATHQLFHESRPVAADVAHRANAWIVEGIAMYMETLRDEDGFHVLGGFDDVRMRGAQYRLLKEDFYVPLADLVAYGFPKLQADKRIVALYGQAAGLTSFLIHYEGGRYRDALVAYLKAVYSGRDDSGTLSQLAGVGYAELDRQYRKFMESGGR